MIKDIAIDDFGDLIFKDGDFDIRASDEQHVVLIVNTAIGSWKEYPLVGVGIQSYLGSSGQTQVLKRNITVQLEADGYTDVAVKLAQSGENINYSINANRNE